MEAQRVAPACSEHPGPWPTTYQGGMGVTQATSSLPTQAVRFVKELYPRLRQDDAAIERYRAALDRLPPITIARDGVLVDGFHRWQAYLAEGTAEVPVENLGNLTDGEILKESIRRNATHGRQLDTRDKRRMADLLYRQGTRDMAELVELLSITEKTAAEYVRDARRDEKQALKEAAWDRWLNCESHREIEAAIGVDAVTIGRWCASFSNELGNEAPASRQHFDIWQFGSDGGDSVHFGKMPPQVVENLLWLYTQPGSTVVDLFTGGGTTIEVAKAMGRRVWASDRKPTNPLLPIHQHDATTGWPERAPRKASLILLDPPYWIQAAGRYSDDPSDLANMSLPGFYEAWAQVIKHCADHLDEDGRLAFITSPAQDGTLQDGRVEDLAFGMYRICEDEGLTCERRIIVAYSTQQATGQQVDAAREHRRLLKLYRDLVVMRG